MQLAVLERFNDPYMQTPMGKGVFLAGVTLGFMADRLAGDEGDIAGTSIFKQIQFGRMDSNNLKRLLSRVPQWLKGYKEELKYTGLITALTACSQEYLLESAGEEMGVNGNFAFTSGFINANKYFWGIFPSQKDSSNKVKPEII
ncbi:MAG: TM1802 family CRISPR-associated protein [Syntrophomonas sp.]